MATTDNFLIRLNQCRNDINEMFTGITAKLVTRKKELLAELDTVENRYTNSNNAAENCKRLEIVVREQKAVLASMESVSKIMGPDIKVNIEKTVNQMEAECLNWKQKIEDLSNISVHFATTDLTDCINQLGSITINKLDYTNRTSLILYDTKGTGVGELSAPHGIALDINDTVYVTDFNNSKILVFSIEGTFIREFGQKHINGPHYICIANHMIYVSNWGMHSIVKFNVNGTFINKIGSECNNNYNNHFNFPYGIAYNNGLVYICDWGNHRIQILNEELLWQSSITHEINCPSDIIIRADTLYITDYGSIHVMSIEGNYIRTLPLVFNTLCYLTLDNNNNLIVSVYDYNSIQIISLLDNTIIHTICDMNTRGVAVTKCNKLIHVCSGGNPKLQCY